VTFAKYFEYYTIILSGAVFWWTRCIKFFLALVLVLAHDNSS